MRDGGSAACCIERRGGGDGAWQRWRRAQRRGRAAAQHRAWSGAAAASWLASEACTTEVSESDDASNDDEDGGDAGDSGSGGRDSGGGAAAATRRLQQRAAAATVMEWVTAAAVATRHGARAAYPEGQWPSAGGRNGSRITMCRAHSHAVPHARTRDQHQLQQRSLRWMRNPLQNDELEIGLCEPRLQFLQAKAMLARPSKAVWQSASQMLTSIHSNGPSLQPSSPTSPFAQNHHTQLLKEVNTFHDNNGRRQ